MYPFVPKSTRKLKPGQFWSVPLRGKRFACGRVLQVEFKDNPTPSRAFFGCLLDWLGSEPPSFDGIAGARPLSFGIMHIKSIIETGGQILGERPLALDGITMPTLLSAMGGQGTHLLHGANPVRLAEKTEWGKYPVLGYWGFDFIQQLVEEHFPQ